TSALYDFTSNELNDNLEVNYDFDTSARIEDVNEQISFEFNLKDLRNNLCSDCQYSVELYPPEPNLYHSRYQSTVVGSFTPTKLGMYSLKITVTDTHNNPTVRKFVYLIGPTDLTDTQYYFRGFNPAHGQPSGISAFDVGTLTFDASTASENRYCSSWIQFSPDEIPEYPYGLYKNISYAVWYSLDSQLPVYKYIGFQKQVIYNINRDYYTSLPSTYQQGEDEIINFGEFNHVLSGMSDYPFSWYWISLKLAGGNPKLYASSRDQSNAIITHRYSTTPAIKSLDEEGIDVLSATSPTSDTRQADIFIEGTGVKQLTIEMPQEPTGEYLAKLDGQTCAADSQFCKITHTTSKELKFTLLLSSDSAHLLEIFPSEYFPYDDAEQR
ncbi:MAG: hypothetical protein KKE05_02575, partial [Nanoarchaeota archaeon]|nr:hypothetical protein [Nanoarchaeota archaeon]